MWFHWSPHPRLFMCTKLVVKSILVGNVSEYHAKDKIITIFLNTTYQSAMIN